MTNSKSLSPIHLSLLSFEIQYCVGFLTFDIDIDIDGGFG